MDKKAIWGYGLGLFVAVIAVGLIVSLTIINTGHDIESWEPMAVHTAGITPTATPGWWDEQPTPSISTKIPIPTLTPTITIIPKE